MLPTVIDDLYLNYAVAGLGGRYCEGKLALTTGLDADELTLLGTLNEAEGANLACHNTNAAGRTAGLAITAAAKAFDTAVKTSATAARTAYTTETGGVSTEGGCVGNDTMGMLNIGASVDEHAADLLHWRADKLPDGDELIAEGIPRVDCGGLHRDPFCNDFFTFALAFGEPREGDGDFTSRSPAFARTAAALAPPVSQSSLTVARCFASTILAASSVAQ